MSLVKSSSKKALQQNIQTEIAAGKSPAQAEAIAYHTQRDAQAHHAPIHKGEHYHKKPDGH